MSEQRNSTVVVALLAVCAAGLAVSGFFLPDWNGLSCSIVKPMWLSHILAGLSLLAIAVSLGYINSDCFIFSSDSRLLYISYLIAVLALPCSMTLTLCHIAALLLLWSIFYSLKYINSENHRIYYSFVAGLLSSVASIMVPQLLYAGIFLLLYCIYRRAQDIARLVLSFVSAVLVPWIYVISWIYIFGDGDIAGFIGTYCSSLSLPQFPETDIVEAVGMAFGIILGVRAVVFVVSMNRERNKAQKNSFGLSVALSVIVFVSGILYKSSVPPMFTAIAAVPLSFSVFDFLTNGRKSEVYIFIALFLLLSVSMRLSEFFPGLLR